MTTKFTAIVAAAGLAAFGGIANGAAKRDEAVYRAAEASHLMRDLTPGAVQIPAPYSSGSAGLRAGSRGKW